MTKFGDRGNCDKLCGWGIILTNYGDKVIVTNYGNGGQIMGMRVNCDKLCGWGIVLTNYGDGCNCDKLWQLGAKLWE